MRSIVTAFLGLSLHAFAADKVLIPFDRAPVHLPKNTAEAATKNLAKAKIPEGFTAELWAGEPLLANPVAFCFDPAGRMFVAETHRLRSSVLDIRHYMFMLEDDLACRNQVDWLASIKKNFPKDWQDLTKETEVIRLVQDSNGDGKADQSSIYADGFNTPLDGLASSVLWEKGDLYFTNIPSFWKLTGKDKAEKREELHRGYGVRFSYTGHDFHGLIKGPDGRLYFSIGDRGASIQTKEGTTIDIPDEGGIFRCELDGSRLELIMRGLRNPQELAFDDFGNLFTGDNDSDQGDRERWVYVVEGADAGWRIGYQHHPLGNDYNPWLAEKMWEPRDPAKKQPACVLSPIANLPDGPSGLVHYPGTGLPAEYAGSFFLAGYKGSTAKSVVSTFKSVPNGASFKLEGLHTFIGNIQATDVDFGPDSRFFVSAWDEGWERSDQGRIFVLAHTEARKAQAAQIAEVQKILAEGFAKKTPEELVKLFAHADQRVRLGAQWEVADRFADAKNTEAYEKLEKLLDGVMKNGVPGPRERLARLHAIWAYGHGLRVQLGTLMNAFLQEAKKTGGIPHDTYFQAGGLPPFMTSLFSDPDEEVRAQAVNFLHDRTIGLPEMNLLIERLKDSSPRVRMFAALVLSRQTPWEKAVGDPHPDLKPDFSLAAKAILELLRTHDGRGQLIEHACVMALAGMANMDVLAEAAKDPKASVRMAALLAYRRLKSPLVAQFLESREPELVMEAARAIHDAPIPEAYPALVQSIRPLPKIPDTGLPEELHCNPMFMIRALDTAFRTGDHMALRIYAGSSGRPGKFRAQAIAMLGRWAKPPARDLVLGTFAPYPARPAADAAADLPELGLTVTDGHDETVFLPWCEAVERLAAKDAAPKLLDALKETKNSLKSRQAALHTLAVLDAPQLSDALAVATADPDAALKMDAATLLGKRDPGAAAKQLAAAFPDAKAAQKRQILVALGNNSSPEAGHALAALVADFAKVPGEVQLELLEAAAKRPEAKAALAKFEAALPANDLVARFSHTLHGGDKAAGEKLFKEHAVAACLRCHKVGGSGGDAGPALDGVAKNHDRRYLLESIVNVNATIAEGFQMVLLTKQNDELVSGLLKKETADAYTLENPPAPGVPASAPIVIKKADVKKRENAGSGMLPDMQKFLTARELRDIIEYVANLK